jgi:hypothetical protein
MITAGKEKVTKVCVPIDSMPTTTRLNTMARTTAIQKYGSSVVSPIKEEASTSASSSDYDFDPRNSTQKRMPSLSLDFQDYCEDKRQFYGISLQDTTQGKSSKPAIALSPMNGLSSPQMLKFQSVARGHCDEPLLASSSHSSKTEDKDRRSSSSSSSAPPLLFLADGWSIAGTLDGWGGKLRLRNPKNKLIAVIEERKFFKAGYAILAPMPMYPGQRPYRKRAAPHADLYVWAIVKQNVSSTHRIQWSIRRQDTHEKYMADEKRNGPSVVRILDEKTGTKCAFAKKDKNANQWDLMVGPNVCPCLMVCVIAIVKGVGENDAGENRWRL